MKGVSPTSLAGREYDNTQGDARQHALLQSSPHWSVRHYHKPVPDGFLQISMISSTSLWKLLYIPTVTSHTHAWVCVCVYVHIWTHTRTGTLFEIWDPKTAYRLQNFKKIIIKKNTFKMGMQFLKWESIKPYAVYQNILKYLWRHMEGIGTPKCWNGVETDQLQIHYLWEQNNI